MRFVFEIISLIPFGTILFETSFCYCTSF